MHGILKYVHDVAPVIFLIGLYGLVRMMIIWKKGAQTTQWPAVEGVVTSVGVEKTRKSASNIGKGNGPKVTFYKPRITYSYEIQGKSFIGKQVQYGMAKRQRVKLVAQQDICAYSVHQTVRVYYDPNEPKESVLQIGLHPFWKNRLLFVVGMMALGCGSWVLTRILP